MKKISQKQQKEAAQKKALLQRITDVYSGALGQEWDESEFATAEILARVIPALRTMFILQGERDWLFEGYSIRHFDRPETACEHLFEQGIRA